VRLEVGRRLIAGVAHGEITRLAVLFDVTTRTLSNWKELVHRYDRGEWRGPGKPRTPPAEREHTREQVAAVLERLGPRAGEGVVKQALDEPLPLVREVLAELKREHRSRRELVAETLRVHVEVHGRHVMWSPDATDLGRDPGRRRVIGEVVRDVGSGVTLGISVGPEPSSAEVAALLERARCETGEAPLVLASDNGPENKREVERWCERHGVTRLWNLPRTPEHNPWVEHGHGELKGACGLGKGVVLDSTLDAARRLAGAAERLDRYRPRPSRGWRTAREAYRDLAPASALVDRQAFRRAVACAIEDAVRGCDQPRARRLAEREAVLETMERFGLITRTRGRAIRTLRKPEGVS
jgi:hypothetical protein